MIFLRILLIFLFSACLMSCIKVNLPPEENIHNEVNITLDPNEIYINADRGIPDPRIPENSWPKPYKKFPNPFNEQPEVNVEEYFDFCEHMLKKFKYSNLTNLEADSFFAQISKYRNYWTEPYGMPSPDFKRERVDPRKRVLIKKIKNGHFQILSITISCGRTLELENVFINANGLFEFELLESWHESYPC